MKHKEAREWGLLRWMFKLFCAYAGITIDYVDEEWVDNCALCVASIKPHCADCPLGGHPDQCAYGHWDSYCEAKYNSSDRIKHAAAILDMIENVEVE